MTAALTSARPPARPTAAPIARWLASAAVSAAAALLLGGCGKPETPTAAPSPPTMAGEVISFAGEADPPTLRLATVASPSDHPVRLPGRLAWDEDRTSRVYPPYAGRIERLLVAVGQRVKRGQALALLSSADIGQAQADLHKAEADQALTRSGLARVRDLVEGGVLARKELDQAEADVARSNAEIARARARLAQYGVVATAVNQSLTLSSPLDGVVVDRNSNAGAEVRNDVQGAALFTISDPSSLWATIDVDESQLSLLKPGQSLSLASAAWPDEQFIATVLNIGAAVDAASRTIKVRARVANPDGRLKAEMFVTAQVAVSGGLPLVPADAVFLRGDQAAVFVRLGKGRYERRAVQVRSAGPQFWSVVTGLKAGEQVVSGGALYLNQLLDGAK